MAFFGHNLISCHFLFVIQDFMTLVLSSSSHLSAVCMSVGLISKQTQ